MLSFLLVLLREPKDVVGFGLLTSSNQIVDKIQDGQVVVGLLDLLSELLRVDLDTGIGTEFENELVKLMITDCEILINISVHDNVEQTLDGFRLDGFLLLSVSQTR